MKYLLLVTIVSPIITSYIKHLLPQIPKKWIPLIAPALGGIAEGVTRLSVGTDLPEGFGVAAGAAGVAVREVVDQWRKDGAYGGAGEVGPLFSMMLCLALAAPMAGCTAKAPPAGPPPTADEQAALDQSRRERRCERALLASTGTATVAALLLRNSNDADLKDGIASGLRGLEEAADAYCEAVILGTDPDVELVAYRSLQAAMAELNRRLLEEAPSSAP